MKYRTRLKLRAIKHGLILLGSGISGNEQKIGKYISVHDNPDDFHIEHFGEDNPNKIVYSISETGNGYGFCAELRMLLEHLAFAKSYGFIPCVRYGKDYLYYEPELENEYSSAYEYFFEPIGKEIDVNCSRNVLKSKLGYAERFLIEHNSDGSHYNEDSMHELVAIFSEYVHIKDEIKSRMFKEFSEIVTPGKRVLGIHYRGTDYKCGYDGHPKQQALEDVINQAWVLLDKDYDLVFLATDDLEAEVRMKEEFGERVKTFDIVRSNGAQSVAFSYSERELHKYNLAYEVLRDAYSLSRCSGLIGGLSQVTLLSRILKRSEGAEYIDEIIIDNGINNNNKQFRIPR